MTPVLGADLLPIAMPPPEKKSVIAEIIASLQANKASGGPTIHVPVGMGSGAGSVYNMAGPNVGGEWTSPDPHNTHHLN